MRVLHLVKTSTGATWAMRQMRELVSLGLDVHVALPGGGPRVAEYEKAGVVVHDCQFDFPMRQPWRFREVARQLRGLVGRLRPDVIHSHFVGTTLTMRLALGTGDSTPRVFQVPGPLHLEHAIFRRVEVATAGPMDWWIGSCRRTVEHYRQAGVLPERVFLSYYGTDIGLFDGRGKGRLRQELGLDPATPIVGMVAFIYAPKAYLGQRRGLKGHEDLIDAVAICRKAAPTLRCVFVGGAWEGAESYEKRVRDYAEARCEKAAIFLGTRSDVVDLLPDIDVLVIPSLSENVGGAVESLLAGVPTVATNVGGLPDLIEDGETGWLVPPGDPERVAGAVLDALRNPDAAKERAARGRERAARLFDCRRTAREVLDIYTGILEGPGKTTPRRGRD
ncbi:MAG: glycosyltransferase family 4 protein [Thermoanaerobaculia bacterium]